VLLLLVFLKILWLDNNDGQQQQQQPSCISPALSLDGEWQS
jgi:hypothetical protein